MKQDIIIPINKTTRLVCYTDEKYPNGYIRVEGCLIDNDGKVVSNWSNWGTLGGGIGIDSQYSLGDLLEAMTRLQKLLLLK